jgi:hypothetical protein
MTVYWVVWDAAAHWIVERLDRECGIPAVRRLREGGVRAAARPPRPNCQTSPSLATLFTGTWPQEHGVTGFTVPGGTGAAVAEHRSAFTPDFPARPPVWRLLAEQGRRGGFVHAPWVFDADGGVGPGVDAAIEAFSRRQARHDIRTVTAGQRQEWTVGVHEVELDTIAGATRLTTREGTHELTGGRGWVPVRLGDATGCWARYLTTSQGPAVVHTGVWSVRVAGANRSLVEHLAKAPVFAGEGVGRLYRAGWFGPRLAEGGDGSAEEVFLSSVECVAKAFGGAVDAVLAGHDADLIVIYLPMTDDIGHELAGWCDERSAAYRPDIAADVWRHLRRGYRWADRVLGSVLDRATESDTVILGADHGMVGSGYLVHVNEQLIGAGLAARATDGGLDPARSAVIYHPANNGSLWVNHDALPGGVVPADRVGDVMRQAMTTLEAITADGRSVVTGFLDEHGRRLTPDAAGALAYIVLSDDYQPTATVDRDAVVRPMTKTAAHVVNTGSARLHATFAAIGPGIPAGIDLGVVDNTLGAGLVLHELGDGDPPAALRRAISEVPVETTTGNNDVGYAV